MKSHSHRKHLRIILAGLVILLFCGVFGVSSGRADDNNFIATFDPLTDILPIPCLEYNGMYYSTDFHVISWSPIQLQLVNFGDNSNACKSVETYYEYSASGTYDFSSLSGVLNMEINTSDFLFDCGPIPGDQTLTVESITSTVNVLTDEDDDTEIWTRDNGNAGDISGSWKFISENGNTYVSIFGSDGSLAVHGNIGYCGERLETGIYGQNFEFEFESIHPTTPGTYHIGSDFEAIDFENSAVTYNLHAYGGSVTVTSVSPMFTGTFSLSDFASGHGLSPNLAGSVSGSFSIPYNSESGGTFIANGNVGQFTININETNARLFK